MPLTLISGQKKIGCMINKWQCAEIQAKSANYATKYFFGEIHGNYVRNDELCQKLC